MLRAVEFKSCDLHVLKLTIAPKISAKYTRLFFIKLITVIAKEGLNYKNLRTEVTDHLYLSNSVIH